MNLLPGKALATPFGEVTFFRACPIRAILLVILNLGSAQNPHALRVRSGSSALALFKLSAPITPGGTGS